MFELKLVQGEVRLSKTEYEFYKRVHIFLLSGEKNIEVDYYNYLNHSPNVQNPNWIYHENKKQILRIDETRKYYPLLVLLKKSKGKAYEVDTAANKLIEQHIDLFKKIYTYHNKPARYVYEKAFEEPLRAEFQVLQDKLRSLEGKGKKYMMQCFTKDFCFHKGFTTSKVVRYDKSIESEEENKKKGRLRPKHEKLKKMFMHFREEKDIFNEELVKMEIWKKASKEDINQLLSKDFKMKLAD